MTDLTPALGASHADKGEVVTQPKLDSEMSTTSQQIAALRDLLTKPRFHVFCGETHTPGPCRDGVMRTEEHVSPWWREWRLWAFVAFCATYTAFAIVWAVTGRLDG